MRKFILLVVVNLTVIYSCLAQFDEKFYFPSHEWHSIDNMNFTEMNFHIDNDTLNAVLFKSKGTTKATIIYYHGTGGNISLNISIAELLSNEGFQVFMIDFRGYGKSTGKPTHLNIANDAQIIFDKIIVKDEFKNYPLIVYGASIGTQIAVKIAKDNQAKIAGLILDGPMSSFTDIALASATEEQKQVISQYVTSPYSAKEDIKDIRNMPKLIIHSEEDEAVPFEQGELVYKNANQPKTMWVYKGKHLESAILDEELFIQKINYFTNSLSDTLGNDKKSTI